jgi:hypothetical protein
MGDASKWKHRLTKTNSEVSARAGARVKRDVPKATTGKTLRDSCCYDDGVAHSNRTESQTEAEMDTSVCFPRPNAFVRNYYCPQWNQ